MSRTDSIFDFLDAGVKAEIMRQKTIANNIANIQTPNYRRLDVKFEEILANSLSEDGSADTNALEPLLFSPKNTPVKDNGNDVSLETEVGKLIENSLKYKTYIRVLNKKYQQITDAIGDR